MTPQLKKVILFTILVLGLKSYSQTEVIEIDSTTATASKVMPYNKAFTIKVLIDADDVSEVFFIKKHRHDNLSETIQHYISSSAAGSYTPPVIPANYYYVKKVAKKNYLFLTLDDDFKLEPSAAYYIILAQKKLGPSVLGFFDNYYQSQYGPPAAKPAALASATASLTEFETSMRKIFGTLVFRYYTSAAFLAGAATFNLSFTANVRNEYDAYSAALLLHNASLAANSAAMAAAAPNFNDLTLKQIQVDAAINKDALAYLMGKELSNNNVTSDINTVLLQARALNLLNGSISLDCIFCNPVNVNSTLLTDINKRISNIESSITSLNNIKRDLYLLRAVPALTVSATAAITNTMLWITHLQTSKTELKGLLALRKAIESKIISEVYDGFRFDWASMASGNSYLNFETRNKVLITPDFGVVTSAFSSKGKDFEYGIVPYLGFHINLMAVDKDLPFKSYRKNWKQYCSIMVGWSLVNMQKENKYGNFFEKSALLTGVGFRLSNVIRITAGTQWMFNLKKDSNNVESKNLFGTPFIGLSFDLNVKQYLNGFADLFSGIGKTKIVSTTPPTATTAALSNQ